MSIKVMTMVWAVGSLSQGETLVLMALADRADDRGFCYPGVEELAHRARCSDRTAQRLLRKLEEQGFVHVEQWGTGRGKTSRYLINLPLLSELGKGDSVTPFEEKKGDKLSPFDSKRVTPGAEKGDTAMSPEPSVSVRREDKEHEPARSPTPAAPCLIPENWQPNEVNQRWLDESGMTSQRQTEVITEFIRWARNSELRRKNWQSTFSANPVVKSAVGRARSGGNHAAPRRPTALQRAAEATGGRRF